MKGRRSDTPPASAAFSWGSAVWTLVTAAAMLGLYYVHRQRIINEKQFILLIFIAVPVAAFLLADWGQDQSQ